MKKAITLTLIMLTLSVIASADDKQKTGLYEKKSDKERIYSVTYDAAWSAAVTAAKEKFQVEMVSKDEGILSFQTGAGMASHGFNVSANLTKMDDGRVRIRLSFQKKKFQLYSWQAGDRIAKQFFEEMDKALEKTNAAK
jgi:hypothetical protein